MAEDECKDALMACGKALYSTFDTVERMIPIVIEKFPFLNAFRLNSKYIRESIFAGFPEESIQARLLCELNYRTANPNEQLILSRSLVEKDARRLSYIYGVIESNCFPPLIVEKADVSLKRSFEQAIEGSVVTVTDHPTDKSKDFVPVYDDDGLLMNDKEEIPIKTIQLVKTVLKNGQVVEKVVESEYVVPGPPVPTDSDEVYEQFFQDGNGIWYVTFSIVRLVRRPRRRLRTKAMSTMLLTPIL
jgi:hypothetical protein